jgi:glutamine synthetase
MTSPQWVDIYWSDLVGRCRYARVSPAAAAAGVAVPRSLVTAGFAGPGDQAGQTRLIPDWATARPHPWDAHVQVVIGDLRTADGQPDTACSRSALRGVLDKTAGQGLTIKAAAELEFYLIDPATRRPIYDAINQYSLTKGAELEFVMYEVRDRLAALGIPIEAVNPEYAGGQVEINIKYSEALAAADRAVLTRHFIRQIARKNGLETTFMAKPWTQQAGSGMHVHQSLWRRPTAVGDEGSVGRNLFHAAGGISHEGLSYTAGLLHYMRELVLLGSATPNAYHRRADYSFAPTRICWGADNRTLAVRVISGSPAATRVEQRDAAADCNIYLAMAGQFSAGLAGLAGGWAPPDPVTGNAYTRDDLPALPDSFPVALELLAGSELAHAALGPVVDELLTVLRPERSVLITSSSDWERDRYMSAV